MDKLIAMKIKYDDGTYSDEIPISVLAENVQWNSSHTLVDVLGNVNLGSGSIQDQITYLFNNKISNADMQAYVNNSMPTIITNWLDANVTPVGSAVVVDESLTIEGAAADAKITGDEFNKLNNYFNEYNKALFVDGNVPHVNGTWNSYYIGVDGARHGDSTKKIVRYDQFGENKYMHIVLSEESTCIFQSSSNLPDLNVPTGTMVGDPISGPCDCVISIPENAICVFISNKKEDSLTNIIYTFNQIQNIFLDFEKSNNINNEREMRLNTILDDSYKKNTPITASLSISSYTIKDDGGRTYKSGKKLTRHNVKAGYVIFIDLTSEDYAIFQNNTNIPEYTYNESIVAVIRRSGYIRVPDEAVCLWIGTDSDDSTDHVYSVESVSEFSLLTKRGNKNIFETSSERPKKIMRGVTFIFDSIGNISISGEAEAESYAYAHYSLSSFPENLYAGGKFYVEFFCDDPNIRFTVYYTRNNTGLLKLRSLYSGDSYIIDIPSDATGVSYRVEVDAGWSGNAKATYAALSAKNNKMLTHDVNKIFNHIENIPDYYFDNNYLVNKLTEIRSASNFINGVVFSFITDIHLNSNDRKSKYLLKYVLDKTSVPFVIFGGDVPSMYGDMNALLEQASEYQDMVGIVGKNRWFGTRGNHEFVTITSSNDNTYNYLENTDTYDRIFRSQEMYVNAFDNIHGCYCIDNEAQKCRILMLNTSDMVPTGRENGISVSVAQLQWIADRIIEKTGWKIIAISHVPCDPAYQTFNETCRPIHDIFVALKNKTTYNGAINIDFTNTTNEFICHVAGHVHLDTSYNTDNILTVITTCDAHYRDDGHNATSETITEHAFDTYCIDFEERKIKAIRVGRGINREWSY